MSKFILLKHNCHICNGLRKDCRLNTKNNLIHCRAEGVNPVGYRCVGEDKQGFYMWAVDDGNCPPEKLEELRRERERSKQQRLEAERLQREKLLSQPERDREIRKLLAQLGLSKAHREELQRRGLTDELIAAGMFRSVSQWQKLDHEVSYRLAGVNLDGRSLNTQAGYLCPIWNPKGQIVGWQLRLDNLEAGGRYRWATSVTKKRHNGATAHLKETGELPITVCRPIEGVKFNLIALAEGIVKPWIAAQLHGQIVLGAAGGNFASSPNTLKAYLDELSAQLETKDLVLYPDAGAIANRHVMEQYRRLHKLVTEWGYILKIGWWGQIAKGDCDIDELPANAPIEIITFAQFEAVAYNPSRLWKGITDIFGKLTKKIEKRLRRLQRSESLSETEVEAIAQKAKVAAIPKVIKYTLGQLPTPEEYQTLGCPKIVFIEGQRLQLWQEAQAKGWQHILDKSAPGQGKSHSVGIAEPEAFGVSKLWYFAANHRNPTVAVIEKNYVDLPIRNNGMKRDTTHKTPLGNDWIVHPKKGEQPDIPGNCHRAELFQILKQRNIPNIEGKRSPICASCRLLPACKSAKGGGYGFRHERQEVLAMPRIRCHPDSAPSTTDFDYSQQGAFWDEVRTLLKLMDSVTVQLADFDQTWGQLEALLPEVHAALTDLRLALRKFLSGELKQPYHGWDDAAIRSMLPEKPNNLQELIAAIEEVLQPDLSFLQEQPDSVEVTKDFYRTAKLANSIFRREAYNEACQKLKQLPLNWLVPFLQVWNGERGSWRCNFGQLTIYNRDYRHSELSRAFKFNVYLDATITAARLAQMLKICEDHILVVEQEAPSYRNLQIIHITGMGKLGKDRSESLIQRVTALKNKLKSDFGVNDFIDWKLLALEGEGHTFVDTRGTNRYINAKSLASFGVPYQNLGYLQALYQTLTGRYVALDKEHPDLEFQAFVEAYTQSEIIQTACRLRSHLRPTEKLTYFFVADYQLNFLTETLPGVRIQEIEAFNITPEAGSAIQQARWAILKAAKKATEMGQKLTQDALASLSGFTQGRVSQIAAQLGGWKVLKKILAVLLNSLYSGTNNSSNSSNLEELDEELKWMAQEFLPIAVVADSSLDALKDVVDVAICFGRKAFEKVLAVTSIEVKSQLLALLMGIFPQPVQQEWLSLVLEGIT